MSGVLHGVGVGPGDPDLLTIRADRLIRGAEVIAYPAPEIDGVIGESFARGIVAAAIPPSAVEVVIAVPMSRDPDVAIGAYDLGAAVVADHLAAGRDVVAICEGDPLFYGSFMYLLARLGERLGGSHPVEITPGVASVTACAAAARYPLCTRNEALMVIPATLPDKEIEAKLSCADVAAFMKLGRNLPRIRELLARLDWAESAHYVERASLPETLSRPLSAAPEEAPYFSMILARKGAGQWRR